MKIVGRDEGKLIVEHPDGSRVSMTDAQYSEAKSPKSAQEPKTEEPEAPKAKSKTAPGEAKDVKAPEETK